MQRVDFNKALAQILERDGRFSGEAYVFIKDALDYTLKRITAKDPGRCEKHVCGRELLEGVRDYALKEYGQMVVTVLESWGVRRCEDFGEIVFNLVDEGVFGKTDTDSRADFTNSYTFEDAFEAPFRPVKAQEQTKPV